MYVKIHSDEQHAMSSQEMQSSLMLTAEFFENVLYYVNCTNFVTRNIDTGIRNNISFLSPVLELHSGIALSRKSFGILYIYIYSLFA
jgi:hypothetical protein